MTIHKKRTAEAVPLTIVKPYLNIDITKAMMPPPTKAGTAIYRRITIPEAPNMATKMPIIIKTNSAIKALLLNLSLFSIITSRLILFLQSS